MCGQTYMVCWHTFFIKRPSITVWLRKERKKKTGGVLSPPFYYYLVADNISCGVFNFLLGASRSSAVLGQSLPNNSSRPGSYLGCWCQLSPWELVSRQILFLCAHTFPPARHWCLHAMCKSVVRFLRCFSWKIILVAFPFLFPPVLLVYPFRISDSASWGEGNTSSIDLLVYNARNQITLWGPNGEINDYAAKNGWAGLISGYYLPRYDILWAAMLESTLSNVPMNQTQVNADILSFAQNWGLNVKDRPPTTPSGDVPIDLTKEILSTYAPGALDAAQWTMHPHTDFQVPSKSVVYQQGGPKGLAAISDDCPFIGDGNGTTLSGFCGIRRFALFCLGVCHFLQLSFSHRLMYLPSLCYHT